jgi:hypothetical protein
LAPGLAATDLLRSATDTILLDPGKGTYSDYDRWPMALTAPLDCAWLYVAATGDWDWAHKRKSDLAARAQLLLSKEFEDTGLVASVCSGLSADPRSLSSSWFDSVRSGHLESFNSAHGCRATVRSAELLARLGKDDTAAQLRAMAARTKEHYLKVFYDPGTRRLAQWVDIEGHRHGFDSRTHLSAAVVCGLIPYGLARELLGEYLERLKQRGFAAYRCGLPTFLEPVPAALHNHWMGKGVEPDGSDQLGVYMNGSVTHHHTYLTLQALYQVGMRHEANDLFTKLSPLVRTGDICGGLHSGVDWRHEDGSPSGYEGLLAEQFQFLLAAITGYLGLELTIDGLSLNPIARASCSDRLTKLRPNFARMAQL